MGNIFQNNINALMLKNKTLANKILTHIPTEVPQLINENNFYNILYGGKKIHNEFNPLGEAQEIFSRCENSPVSIFVVYGLGLGYLFQYTSLNSKGTVILYEPDLNILRTVFEFVDFSKDFTKNNVYITDDYDELTEYIYKKSGTKNSPQLLTLASQIGLAGDNFDVLVKNLQNVVGAYSLDLKFTIERFYTAIKMLLMNIPNLINTTPLLCYKDVYKGKTAVIVSAGPTLDRNIETIKQNRDKFILFTVGTAYKTLVKNGIKPDFLSMIETFDSSNQIKDTDTSDIYLISEPYSNPNIYSSFEFKKVLSHVSANMPVNEFWQELTGIDIKDYWTKGTVSYNALNSARLLGCSKIILVGQDLAYVDGQCYSKNSNYKDLICSYNENTQKWEIAAKSFDEFADLISNSDSIEERRSAAKRRLDNLNSSVYYVKGINGDMIPTESVYAAFVKPLSEFAEHFNEIEYINTSMVGAQIDGFKNMPLEEAIKGLGNIGEIELANVESYDKDKILENLKNSLELLKSALPLIQDGQRLLKNLNNTLKRMRAVDVDSLKILKKISENYLFLSSNFSAKSKLYDLITAEEKIALDYEMKMLKDFTFENVTNFAKRLEVHYKFVTERISEIENIILTKFEEIK